MNLGRMSTCSLSLKGRCLTESFLHLLVSQDLGRKHGFVDLPTLELASVRLSLTTTGQKKSSISGLQFDIPIQSG